MLIRPATIEDLPQCGPCAEKFYASSQHLKTFDINRFVAMWTALLSNETGAMFLVLDQNEIVGAIAGVAYPEAYSDELICQEFYWFISPEHRGMGGVRLYKMFEDWARSKGCSQIRMGHLLDSMPEKVSKFYERMGFVAAEVNYFKSLKETP